MAWIGDASGGGEDEGAHCFQCSVGEGGHTIWFLEISAWMSGIYEV